MLYVTKRDVKYKAINIKIEHDKKDLFVPDFFEIGKGLLFCAIFRDESLKSNDWRVYYYLQIHKNNI